MGKKKLSHLPSKKRNDCAIEIKRRMFHLKNAEGRTAERLGMGRLQRRRHVRNEVNEHAHLYYIIYTYIYVLSFSSSNYKKTQ